MQPLNLPVLPLNCLPGTSLCTTLAGERQWKWNSLPHSFLHILAGPSSPPQALPFPTIQRNPQPGSSHPGGSLQKHPGETGRRQTDCSMQNPRWGGRKREKQPWPGPTQTVGWFMFRQLCSLKGCMRTNTWAPSRDGELHVFPCPLPAMLTQGAQDLKISIYLFIYLFIFLVWLVFDSCTQAFLCFCHSWIFPF